MLNKLLEKYRLYTNRKLFRCTLIDRSGHINHMDFKQLEQFLKENEGFIFMDFLPFHVETIEHFKKFDAVAVLYKHKRLFFKGPLILRRCYDVLGNVGFSMYFESNK